MSFEEGWDPRGGDQLWDSGEKKNNAALVSPLPALRPEPDTPPSFLGRSLRLYHMGSAPSGAVLTE